MFFNLIVSVNGLEYVAKKEGEGVTGENAIAWGERLGDGGTSSLRVVLEDESLLVIPDGVARHYRFEPIK